jgi:hypothetical protein
MQMTLLHQYQPNSIKIKVTKSRNRKQCFFNVNDLLKGLLLLGNQEKYGKIQNSQMCELKCNNEIFVAPTLEPVLFSYSVKM